MTTRYHCDVCGLSTPQQGTPELHVTQVTVGGELAFEFRGETIKHLCTACYSAVQKIVGKHRAEVHELILADVQRLYNAARTEESNG